MIRGATARDALAIFGLLVLFAVIGSPGWMIALVAVILTIGVLVQRRRDAR